uniref:Uncharacterized protein n=1 Tax=Lotus japonicus TaxID=34305 RepID=I3SSP4_LOTJA|nr:unknown [Lotus japonicus]
MDPQLQLFPHKVQASLPSKHYVCLQYVVSFLCHSKIPILLQLKPAKQSSTTKQATLQWQPPGIAIDRTCALTLLVCLILKAVIVLPHEVIPSLLVLKDR